MMNHGESPLGCIGVCSEVRSWVKNIMSTTFHNELWDTLSPLHNHFHCTFGKHLVNGRVREAAKTQNGIKRSRTSPCGCGYS